MVVFPAFRAALSDPKPALFRGVGILVFIAEDTAQLSTLGRVPQRVLKSVKPFASRFGLLKYPSLALAPDCGPNMSVVALFRELVATPLSSSPSSRSPSRRRRVRTNFFK